MSYAEYFTVIEKMTLTFGYKKGYAKIFDMDIRDCFDKGKSVDECFDIVF